MDWADDAIVLGARTLGEGSAVVEVLAREQGRHSGLVRGLRTLRPRGVLEPGTTVKARWRGRLADHLGSFTLEADNFRAARLMDQPAALAALASACAITKAALPERECHAEIHHALTLLLDSLDDDAIWPALYVRYEFGLLDALGYGLDLEACAVTGQNGPLSYVSPRTGRAVSAAAAEPYLDKLLALPPFLADPAGGHKPVERDVLDGLRLTRHFLEMWVLGPAGQTLPGSRERLWDILSRTVPPSVS